MGQLWGTRYGAEALGDSTRDATSIEERDRAMFWWRFSGRSWIRRTTVSRAGFVLAALFAVLSVSASPVAAPSVRDVDGNLETRVVSPAACTSAVALCTHGRISGDIRGTFDFTGDTLTPAPNQTNPTVFLYTGQVVIQTDDGHIVGTDAGVIDFATGAFVDLTTIPPGQSTGMWAGATGQLRFSGSCDLAAGVCKSEYDGTVQRH
jgi:hypothetical protein